MVYHRKTTRRPRRTARRTVRRARRMPLKRSRTNMMVSTGRSIIANRYKTKLIYSDFYDTATNGIGILYHQFNANSLYDPDFTFTGHQPRGFDQLMTLYQSYTVTGVKIIVEGRLTSANLDTNPITGNIILGCLQPNGGVLPVDMTDASENRQYATYVRGDQTSFKLSKYFSIAKIVGVPSSRVITNDQYTGTVSSSPSYTPLINLGFVEMNSSVVMRCKYNVTLIYYVQLSSPVQMNRS